MVERFNGFGKKVLMARFVKLSSSQDKGLYIYRVEFREFRGYQNEVQSYFEPEIKRCFICKSYLIKPEEQVLVYLLRITTTNPPKTLWIFAACEECRTVLHRRMNGLMGDLVAGSSWLNREGQEISHTVDEARLVHTHRRVLLPLLVYMKKHHFLVDNVDKAEVKLTQTQQLLLPVFERLVTEGQVGFFVILPPIADHPVEVVLYVESQPVHVRVYSNPSNAKKFRQKHPGELSTHLRRLATEPFDGDAMYQRLVELLARRNK